MVQTKETYLRDKDRQIEDLGLRLNILEDRLDKLPEDKRGKFMSDFENLQKQKTEVDSLFSSLKQDDSEHWSSDQEPMAMLLLEMEMVLYRLEGMI